MTLVLWAVLACSGPGFPSAAAEPPQADQPEAVEATAEPERVQRRLECHRDEDCAVVPSIQGLDYIPGEPQREVCGDHCYVAIHVTQVEDWEAARAATARLRCDKKRAKCSSIASRVAKCVLRQCEVMPR